MKKIIILLTGIVLTMTSCSSSKCLETLAFVPDDEKVLDEYNQLSYSTIVDCEGLTRNEIYTRANSYFIYNYNSGKAVIQQQDKEEGILIGKGLSKEMQGTSFYNLYHILRVDIKDNKARISITVNTIEYHYMFNGVWMIRDVELNNMYPFVPKKMKIVRNSEACLFLVIKLVS